MCLPGMQANDGLRFSGLHDRQLVDQRIDGGILESMGSYTPVRHRDAEPPPLRSYHCLHTFHHVEKRPFEQDLCFFIKTRMRLTCHSDQSGLLIPRNIHR